MEINDPYVGSTVDILDYLSALESIPLVIRNDKKQLESIFFCYYCEGSLLLKSKVYYCFCHGELAFPKKRYFDFVNLYGHHYYDRNIIFCSRDCAAKCGWKRYNG